jgi:hypothetical protein
MVFKSDEVRRGFIREWLSAFNVKSKLEMKEADVERTANYIADNFRESWDLIQTKVVNEMKLSDEVANNPAELIRIMDNARLLRIAVIPGTESVLVNNAVKSYMSRMLKDLSAEANGAAGYEYNSKAYKFNVVNFVKLMERNSNDEGLSDEMIYFKSNIPRFQNVERKVLSGLLGIPFVEKPPQPKRLKPLAEGEIVTEGMKNRMLAQFTQDVRDIYGQEPDPHEKVTEAIRNIMFSIIGRISKKEAVIFNAEVNKIADEQLDEALQVGAEEQSAKELTTDTVEFHAFTPDLMVYNYVGPGTNYERRLKGKPPKNTAFFKGTSPYDVPIDYLDWQAMIHDTYYISENLRIRQLADIRFIENLKKNEPAMFTDPKNNMKMKLAETLIGMKNIISGGSTNIDKLTSSFDDEPKASTKLERYLGVLAQFRQNYLVVRGYYVDKDTLVVKNDGPKESERDISFAKTDVLFLYNKLEEYNSLDLDTASDEKIKKLEDELEFIADLEAHYNYNPFGELIASGDKPQELTPESVEEKHAEPQLADTITTKIREDQCPADGSGDPDVCDISEAPPVGGPPTPATTTPTPATTTPTPATTTPTPATGVTETPIVVEAPEAERMNPEKMPKLRPQLNTAGSDSVELLRETDNENERVIMEQFVIKNTDYIGRMSSLRMEEQRNEAIRFSGELYLPCNPDTVGTESEFINRIGRQPIPHNVLRSYFDKMAHEGTILKGKQTWLATPQHTERQNVHQQSPLSRSFPLPNSMIANDGFGEHSVYSNMKEPDKPDNKMIY